MFKNINVSNIGTLIGQKPVWVVTETRKRDKNGRIRITSSKNLSIYYGEICSVSIQKEPTERDDEDVLTIRANVFVYLEGKDSPFNAFYLHDQLLNINVFDIDDIKGATSEMNYQMNVVPNTTIAENAKRTILKANKITASEKVSYSVEVNPEDDIRYYIENSGCYEAEVEQMIAEDKYDAFIDKVKNYIDWKGLNQEMTTTENEVISAAIDKCI